MCRGGYFGRASWKVKASAKGKDISCNEAAWGRRENEPLCCLAKDLQSNTWVNQLEKPEKQGSVPNLPAAVTGKVGASTQFGGSA